MQPSDIQNASGIANVIVGVVGIASLLISGRALRELTRDRHERVRPKLLFERGAEGVACAVEKTDRVPGVNPSYVLASGVTSPRTMARPDRHWAKLKNHGLGSALHVRVWFVTRRASTKSDDFEIDDAKRTAFPYDLGLNSLPTVPSHIDAGAAGQLTRVPTPLADLDGGRTGITGVLVIECVDIYDDQHRSYQNFYGWYHEATQEGRQTLMVTFGDEIPARVAEKAVSGALRSIDARSNSRGEQVDSDSILKRKVRGRPT